MALFGNLTKMLSNVTQYILIIMQILTQHNWEYWFRI